MPSGAFRSLTHADEKYKSNDHLHIQLHHNGSKSFLATRLDLAVPSSIVCCVCVVKALTLAEFMRAGANFLLNAIIKVKFWINNLL